MSPERKASNAILAKWCATITGHVLSIGSARDDDGTGKRYRDYFSRATSYTTSEPVPTPLCDLVLDVRNMDGVKNDAYDCVFCSGVLEHVDDVNSAVRECFRILKPHGVFLVGVPFRQRLHRAPHDFWRFTEYGIRYLLRRFVIEDLKTLGDPVFPETYWVRARKA